MKNNVIITSENAVDYNMVYAAVIEEKWIYLYLKYNSKDNSAKIATLIYSLILMGSLILLSFDIYRISYNHQSRNGTVMMGLYNLYVEYTVDGKKYEGHSGTTATEPTIGMSTTVYYDSKHPSHIIVLDEMGERTVLFIVIGGAIAVVSFALIISQGTFTKKNRKYKVQGSKDVILNQKHVRSYW